MTVDSSPYHELLNRRIATRLVRDEYQRALGVEEMRAIFRALDREGMSYDGLGKNEEQRALVRLRILEEDEEYQRVRRRASVAQREYLEAEADVESYLEVRRVQRDDLRRAEIDAGMAGVRE